MIFVTVGNHDQAFDQLLKKMDEIAGRTDEKVIMQIGCSKYKPLHAEFYDFIGSAEIKKFNRDARIVVCQAGAGSILTALKEGTSVIIVPRLKKYGEVIDDHQLEIMEALSGTRGIKAINDIDDTENCLAIDIGVTPVALENNRLSDSVKQYLLSISGHMPMT